LPLAFLLIAAWIPASRELKSVIIVQAAMPGAVIPVLLARHYRGHPVTALRVALSTALLSLVTIPLWISLGMTLLPSPSPSPSLVSCFPFFPFPFFPCHTSALLG
jgi:predicted permease